MPKVISVARILGMLKSWFSVARARFGSGARSATVKVGFSVGAIQWFAFGLGPQNGSSFLLETGEWVNRVTCLNSVESCRCAGGLEMTKSGLSSLAMFGSSGLIGKVPGSLATKFLSLRASATLSLIG